MAETITLNIEGMTCDHCVKAVTGALSDVPGVSNADVNLDAKRAVVEGSGIDVSKLVAAVEEEGYTASVPA